MKPKRPAYETLAALALACLLAMWIHPALGGAVAAVMVFYAWLRGL